jgi:hypothetical protein
MLESGSSGSVRGASSNGRPYREPRPFAGLRGRPYERTVSARKRSSAQGVGCASSYRSNWLRNCTGERELPLESAGLWQLSERNE